MACLVEHCMTGESDCAVVKKTDTIRNLKAELTSKNLRMAVVVDSKKCAVGVITVNDIKYATDDDEVFAYASKPPYTILPTEPIGKAREKIEHLSIKHGHRIHQLTVVEDEANNKFLGILWDHHAELGIGCTDKSTSKKSS